MRREYVGELLKQRATVGLNRGGETGALQFGTGKWLNTSNLPPNDPYQVLLSVGRVVGMGVLYFTD